MKKTEFKNYSQAIQSLESLISYEKKPPSSYNASFYSLTRFQTLLDCINNPQRNLQCIHIAGTDGKGSTAALLASLLQLSGKKVGLYTSPHLYDYTERILCNGKHILKKDFTKILSLLMNQMIDISKKSSLEMNHIATVFELLTAMCFHYFEQEKVDFAVIETGLGGRLDATNVVNPLCSIITPVAKDHVPLLGTTLSEIATEKAGIIKPTVPVYSARQVKAVKEVIEQKSKELQSPYYYLPDDIKPVRVKPQIEGYRFNIQTGKSISKKTFDCPLLGYHQIENFILASTVAGDLLKNNNTNVKRESLLALGTRLKKSLSWQARSECHQINHQCWILDGAHTVQGAKALRKMLNELFPGKKIHHRVAFSDDKLVSQFLKVLIAKKDKLSAYQSTHARSLDPKIIYNQAQSLNLSCQPGNSLNLFSSEIDSGNINCVSGSLFWIADVKKVLF